MFIGIVGIMSCINSLSKGSIQLSQINSYIIGDWEFLLTAMVLGCSGFEHQL